MTGEETGRNAPLAVGIIGERLIISIGVDTLAFAVVQGAGYEKVFRITNADAAALGIAAQLLQEDDEDGTTPVHVLLDAAARDAWENGAEGFGEGTP